MRREKRKTIAVRGDEIKVFETEYAAAKYFGVSVTSVQAAKRWNGTCADGWEIYDTPKRIRKRIEELNAQIKMLKQLNIEED